MIIALLLAPLSDGWGQSELRSGKKGATNPAPVTSTSIDADHQALDVNVAGGTLGNVTISNADGAINDGANNTIKATVLDLTNSNPITTAIVDSSGNQITSFGGGTQYDQGTASTTTDTMTMAGCVRVDTPAVAAGVIDGDRARCMVDSIGRLWVHVGSIDGGTITSITNPVTVTDGSGAFNVVIDSGAVAATQSGTWNIGTVTSITNPVAVTGTFWQATQPVSGTVTANAGTGTFFDGIIKDGTGDTTQANVSSGSLHVACQSGCSGGTQYAEDTVHSSGDQMTMAGVVRSDAAGALAADGDRTVLQVDGNGYLKVVNINPNLAADNSTLSTQKVPVLPGTVSTSAPTWISGNQSSLSLQTDGSVRAAVTNTVTIASNSSINNAQVAGNTISTGVGASGTGTQRVAALLHDGTDTAQVTATAGGSLQVECTSGCGGSGGTSMADDAAFTPGTTSITPAGAMFDDVTPDSVNEGDAGVLRMSANRNLYSTIRDAAGNERGANVNASNELLVAATGTVTANAGTNLNTSALLTTSAHDAAFGTAGSADTQVRTVQGIASMTPLQVQSNSANLATEASVDGLEGGLGAAADAAATAGSTGSVTAKLRLMTSQLDTISTNLSSLLTSSQLVDDDQTGASVHYRTSAGSTEDEHEVKGSAGRLFSITATNTNAAVRYLRCANQVIGSTTPGTTTVFLGLAIPGATTGAGFTTNFGPMGIAFSTGLTCWLVTGAADTDVAEVAANEIKVIYTYK